MRGRDIKGKEDERREMDPWSLFWHWRILFWGRNVEKEKGEKIERTQTWIN